MTHLERMKKQWIKSRTIVENASEKGLFRKEDYEATRWCLGSAGTSSHCCEAPVWPWWLCTECWEH